MKLHDMKVGILTTFYTWDEAYSLTGVVLHQIVSLLKHGYTPVLFVLENFNDQSLPEAFAKDGVVEVRKVIPQIITEPYHGIVASRQIPPQFEKDVARVTAAYNQHFKDIGVMLCHDIIFQDSFLAYNAGLRKMLMSKDQRFLHWMHSGPSFRPEVEEPISYLYSLPPQSTLVYMNGYDAVRAAEMYGIYAKDVRIVHNPIDYRTLPNMHPLVTKIIETAKLNEADIIAVYPLSTTRMGDGGKQLHKAIKIMGSLKELGNEVRYIIPNAHANGDREKEAIKKMLELGKEHGLEPMKDLIFTSLIGAPEYENGVPHDVVLQLFQISDLFLFPSVSENCPLILLEAALTKNLMVLNEDFSPMKDFVGASALYFKFDSVTTTTNHPNGEDVYYFDVAKIIMAELQASRSHQCHVEIRKKFNLDTVFEKELEPLFYEEKKPQGLKLPSKKEAISEEKKAAMTEEIRAIAEKYDLPI